jgi:hypothetical protein
MHSSLWVTCLTQTHNRKTRLGERRVSAFRVHIFLPGAAEPSNAAGKRASVPTREYTPGLHLGENDSIVVNLDRTNLFLLFKKMDKRNVDGLFAILSFVLDSDILKGH